MGLDSRADFPKAPPYEEVLRNAKVPVPGFGIVLGFGMVLGLVLHGLGMAWDYVGMVLGCFLHCLGMVLGPVSLLVLSAWWLLAPALISLRPHHRPIKRRRP